jgi:hypothetical protein
MKLLAAALTAVAATSLAQDPLLVAPNAYKLWFENPWVRVVRVHYGPREQVVAHDHTSTSAAFVYLNDSGKVIFDHIDKDYSAVTRDPTKAGSFRVYYGLQEVHKVSNNSDLPSEFLRVEFKTEPKGEMTLKGKFFREPRVEGEIARKIQFENEQIRITRLVWPPGKSVEIKTAPEEPALIVALSEAGASVALHTGNKTSPLTLSHGRSRWVGADQQETWENTGRGDIEALRFDFKTAPMSKAELEKRRLKH